MAIKIKYRPLKAFLLAVETHSFTRAAGRLGVTQPSFTALIRNLEDTLELQLFERTTRRIALTNAGQDFHDRILRPLTDLEEAYRSMSDLATMRRGAIAIGALPSTALTLIPPTLKRLRELHPALKTTVIEAHNDEIIEMLRTNQVEFALGAILDKTSNLETVPLMLDTFVAVYPPDHPIQRRDSLHWVDLIPYDLILLSRGSSARQIFDQAVGGDDGDEAGLRFDVTNMTTAIQLVRQSLGVAILPQLALPALLDSSLRHRPIEDESARRMIGILRRQDRSLAPAGAAFLQQIQVVVQQLSPLIGSSPDAT